jgi:capsular exopolysaccharide synthesis family protein
VILQDAWDNSISTLEEAEELAPLPSLGSIPMIKASKLSSARLLPPVNGNGSRNGNGTHSKTSIQDSHLPFEATESIRAVCASILLSRSDERPRVIVVTSASHSEGKTTLATHLGRAFADAGSSTLLIEADMRKPDLSKNFSVGTEDGLSLYLAGHVSPWPKVQQTDIANLFVVAGGPIPPNPAALLHSDKLDEFLQVAAAEYNVVIVDSPPLSLADARILGMKADGVVLVVRAGRTAKNQVRRAWTLLESSGANVLGMVLNGTQVDHAELVNYGYYHTENN